MIAVASRDHARAETYARANGIERAYGSYEALLDDPDVEAVYISLPNGMHVEWTLRALAAGKHVLCEKPLTRRASEAEEAFDLAERAGLVLSEGFMWRHDPQTRELARLVASGAIGRLRLIRACFSFRLGAVHGTDDARFSPDLDGGSLMDVGSYCVNAVRLLGGEPTRVHAEQVVGPSGVDVCLAATLRLPGRRRRALRLWLRPPLPRRARARRRGREPLRRRPVPRSRARDRAATRARARPDRGRANRDRRGGLLPPRARESCGRDPRPGASPARS